MNRIVDSARAASAGGKRDTPPSSGAGVPRATWRLVVLRRAGTTFGAAELLDMAASLHHGPHRCGMPRSLEDSQR